MKFIEIIMEIAQHLYRLVQGMEIHASQQEDQSLVVVDSSGPKPAIPEPVRRITPEDGGIAAIGFPKIHAEAIGETNGFPTGLGPVWGVIVVKFGCLVEGKTAIPFPGIAIMHFLYDIPAGGGRCAVAGGWG